VLGPNSKTSRSNPGLWAIRIAVSCAWLEAVPPVRSGQALAGVLPGLAGALGLGAAVVGAGVVGAALAVRLAGAVEDAGAPVGTGLRLGLLRGRTTRSGPQALTTTTDMATRSAPYRRRRPINASIVMDTRCSVEFADKLASPSYAERTNQASTTVLR
jgi:hypothetical protein